MGKINLAIVDDDYLIVALLKSFFNDSEQTVVQYDGTDGAEFLKFLDQSDPELLDILLLDLKMKSVSGLDVLKHCRSVRPDLKVIVISSHYQDHSIGFMTREGVAAFLPKGITPKHLLEIVKYVQCNGVYLTKEQVNVLRDQISAKVPGPLANYDGEPLTEREIQIIKLLCQQKTAKEVGETLFIAQRTVEGHKNNIFAKVGVKNMTGLIVYALQQHIVALEEISLAAK